MSKVHFTFGGRLFPVQSRLELWFVLRVGLPDRVVSEFVAPVTGSPQPSCLRMNADRYHIPGSWRRLLTIEGGEGLGKLRMYAVMQGGTWVM